MLKPFQAWQKKLFKPVDSSTLGLFRILFGLVLITQAFIIFNNSYVQKNFVLAEYHFPFGLFEFLHLGRFPAFVIHLIFLSMGLAAVAITAGLCFRFASLTFFITFLYVFLFEKALYNDHYYLMLLISFIFIFSNANRWPLLNVLRLKKINSRYVPFWQLYLLRIQFILVYFFSAVSKLNSDWLIHAQPIARILEGTTFLNHPLNKIWIAYLFSYAGILLDFLMATLLFLGRYRVLAFCFVLLFNLTNHWLFHGDIETFPFLMIAGLVLFLDPEAPRHIISKTQKFFHLPQERMIKEDFQSMSFPHSKLIFSFVIIYILIQIVVPLRHSVLYPDDPRWSYEGNRFSWFLKLNAKSVDMKIKCFDPQTKKMTELDYKHALTGQQLWIDNIPDMMVQYAHYLKEDLEKIGVKNPKIFIDAKASLNGRPYQQYIDPNVNLADTQYPFLSHAAWIVPLNK